MRRVAVCWSYTRHLVDQAGVMAVWGVAQCHVHCPQQEAQPVYGGPDTRAVECVGIFAKMPGL